MNGTIFSSTRGSNGDVAWLSKYEYINGLKYNVEWVNTIDQVPYIWYFSYNKVRSLEVNCIWNILDEPLRTLELYNLYKNGSKKSNDQLELI